MSQGVSAADAARLLLLPFTFLLSLLTSPARRLLLALLSLGPIPRHIAFIMDGNRRWATSQPIPLPVRAGHISGFSALKTVLEACLELRGLDTVTVYAFAIDNFKRSEEEVQALMGLAKRNLMELAGHGELLARHSVRLRIVGRRKLLPPDVRAAVERVEEVTRRNHRATLNVCIPYASRDEMAGAVRELVADTLSSKAEAEEADRGITCDALEARMMLAHSPPVDVLVRTSGVYRLSDFMLWQCAEHTHLHFTKRYWPLFGLRELVPIILDYQRAEFRRQLWEWAR
ncbi:Di-trans-poly-cis-decaprenylcistransferase [Tilletiopsis washingtonensis]|uniref:Alkyl transferase n=1 Tax=Tilletiopsis washingtonensis TaxID=58919 RepID=A0A316ZAR3_9BASI|nr:Di-trans-poly-cis-decaprenylcistransferase [Tilletiopsis washingtonensis]PWN97355.1 Di-trans-poly-cis-decaprenylcistransferase [Tilletiopsis washingtonensis]